MSTRSWQMTAAMSVVPIPDSFGWRDASAQTRWFTTSTAFLKSSGRGHASESRCISVSRVSRARELAISPAWCPPIPSQTANNTPRAPIGCPTTTTGSNSVSRVRSRITNPSSLFVRGRPMSDFPYAANFPPHTLFQSPPASALRLGSGALLHWRDLSPEAAIARSEAEVRRSREEGLHRADRTSVEDAEGHARASPDGAVGGTGSGGEDRARPAPLRALPPASGSRGCNSFGDLLRPDAVAPVSDPTSPGQAG